MLVILLGVPNEGLLSREVILTDIPCTGSREHLLKYTVEHNTSRSHVSFPETDGFSGHASYVKERATECICGESDWHIFKGKTDYQESFACAD